MELTDNDKADLAKRKGEGAQVFRDAIQGAFGDALKKFDEATLASKQKCLAAIKKSKLDAGKADQSFVDSAPSGGDGGGEDGAAKASSTAPAKATSSTTPPPKAKLAPPPPKAAPIPKKANPTCEKDKGSQEEAADTQKEPTVIEKAVALRQRLLLACKGTATNDQGNEDLY